MENAAREIQSAPYGNSRLARMMAHDLVAKLRGITFPCCSKDIVAAGLLRKTYCDALR